MPTKKPLTQINAVPYIDVMLVLLVIFIITAPFLKSAVDVQLPRTESMHKKAEPHKPVVVTIDKSGRYFLNVGQSPEKPLSLKALIANVTKVSRTREDFQLLIHGDETVSYGLVAKLISQLQAAGIKKATLVTEPSAP